ncbi:hypothetical protein Plhal710r2_c005g0022221 [Plasmopara halstedii]
MPFDQVLGLAVENALSHQGLDYVKLFSGLIKDDWTEFRNRSSFESIEVTVVLTELVDVEVVRHVPHVARQVERCHVVA